MKQVTMTRRNFCKCSALAALSLGLNPWGNLFSTGHAAAPSTNYYLAHSRELIGAFAGSLEGVYQFLAPELGMLRSRLITQQALTNFQALLPTLPDVGGDRNWDTEFIPIAAWYVALYEPMRAHGKTAEDLGRIIYDLNSYSLSETPKEQVLAEQKRLFSPEYLQQQREWAAWTQRRELPGNWVATFIEAPPGPRDADSSFDYGIEYSECGLVKFFQSQGRAELAPYVCLNDFARSKTFGTGLRRSKTVAMGDGVCNFRYKADRPVTQDWSTEIGRIRSRKA
jgi:hypothetical protein